MMKKHLQKVFAVTLVTAFLFIISVFPASASSSTVYWSNYTNDGLFVPTPAVPDSSSLPFTNTQIFEFYLYSAEHQYVVYRYYVDADKKSDSSLSAPSFAFLCDRDVSTNNGIIFINSKSSVYFESYWFYTTDAIVHYHNNFGEYQTGSTVASKVTTKLNDTPTIGNFGGIIVSNKSTLPWNGQQLSSSSYGSNSSTIFNYINNRYSTTFDNMAYGVTTRQYITPAQANQITNDEAFSHVEQVISDKVDSAKGEIVNSVNGAKTEIITAVNEAADKIVNAGSDAPDLNTEQNGMSEVISNLNNWVSELGNFESQLKQNEVENSENMAQAKTFINGFFNIVPSALIACFSLFLVIIVVVKLVGR